MLVSLSKAKENHLSFSLQRMKPSPQIVKTFLKKQTINTVFKIHSIFQMKNYLLKLCVTSSVFPLPCSDAYLEKK